MGRSAQFLLFLAALACSALLSSITIADEKPPQKTLAEQMELLKSDDPDVRADAVDAIGKLGPQAASAVPELINLLGDRRHVGHVLVPVRISVDTHTASALHSIGEPAGPDLVRALANPDANIRASAAEILKDIQPPPKDLVEALTRTLKDSDSDVRRNTITALGSLKEAALPALPALLEILKSDPDWNVRMWPCSHLPEIDPEGRQAIAPLIAALADKDPNVRGEAAAALGAYGLRSKEAITPLISMLADPKSRYQAITSDMIGQRPVRYDAAETLGKIGPSAEAASVTLRTMMNNDKHDLVCIAAAVAVLRIDPKDSDALPVLIRIAADKDPHGAWVVRDAIHAMAELGPLAAPAVPLLKKLLKSGREYVPGNAAQALVAIEGKEVLPLILERLQTAGKPPSKKRKKKQDEAYYSPELLREQLAAAICSLGPDAAPAIPQLSALVSDKKFGGLGKNGVLAALRKLGPAGVPIISIALTDEYEWIRRTAAYHLGDMGTVAAPALPELQKLAESDPDESVKKAAREAIEAIQAGQEKPEK